MASRTAVFATGSALLLLAAGTLTACATGSGVGLGNGAGSGADQEIEVDAAWLDAGRIIGLVTYGSSSCVPQGDPVEYSGGVLNVTLVEPAADTPCTRDLVPRVTLVGVPEEVDPASDLEIRVTGEGYRGDTDLDGVAGLSSGGETDYLPSAGWTGEDDQFVFLSWGSSTCVPVVEDVTASGPSELTVTFVTPPEDQVCTMDMAARAIVIGAPDLEDDDSVYAVLAGTPEFDNIRVLILGEN